MRHQRTALMTRVHKRDVDKGALRDSWEKQAVELGFDPRLVVAETARKDVGKNNSVPADGRQIPERDVASDADRAAA